MNVVVDGPKPHSAPRLQNFAKVAAQKTGPRTEDGF